MANQGKQIKSTTSALMISTALFFDTFQALIQVIPLMGQILASLVAIFAFLTLWLWFKMNGIKFTSPKRVAALGGGFLIELIPILNILPAWTLAVTLILSDTKVKNIANSETSEPGEKGKAS